MRICYTLSIKRLLEHVSKSCCSDLFLTASKLMLKLAVPLGNRAVTSTVAGFDTSDGTENIRVWLICRHPWQSGPPTSEKSSSQSCQPQDLLPCMQLFPTCVFCAIKLDSHLEVVARESPVATWGTEHKTRLIAPTFGCSQRNLDSCWPVESAVWSQATCIFNNERENLLANRKSIVQSFSVNQRYICVQPRRPFRESRSSNRDLRQQSLFAGTERALKRKGSPRR